MEITFHGPEDGRVVELDDGRRIEFERGESKDVDDKAAAENLIAQGDFSAAGSKATGHPAAAALPRTVEDLDETKPLEEQTSKALQAEADRRNLTVTGTGQDGRVVKNDLVAAIAADLEANG